MRNLTLDEFRAALRDVAADVDADDIQPLSLPVTRRSRSRWSVFRLRRRAPRTVAALGAAAAVVGIVAGVIFGLGGNALRTANSLSGLPQYYVAILGISNPHVATVRDLATGAVLATVKAAKAHQFDGVAAAPDDRSFVLLESPVSHVAPLNTPDRLFLLNFNPADGAATLRELPIPAINGLSGLAMSPNGAEVAVASNWPETANSSHAWLTLYSLTGQLLRQWQGNGTICGVGVGWGDLAWGANNELVYEWGPGRNMGDQVQAISAVALSGRLVDASRLLIPASLPGGWQAGPSDFVLSGNGMVLVTGISRAHPRHPRTRAQAVVSELAEFSVSTGKVIRTFLPELQYTGVAWWANESGGKLIVTAPVGSFSSSFRVTFGALTNGRFMPFAVSPSTGTITGYGF